VPCFSQNALFDSRGTSSSSSTLCGAREETSGERHGRGDRIRGLAIRLSFAYAGAKRHGPVGGRMMLLFPRRPAAPPGSGRRPARQLAGPARLDPARRSFSVSLPEGDGAALAGSALTRAVGLRNRLLDETKKSRVGGYASPRPHVVHAHSLLRCWPSPC